MVNKAKIKNKKPLKRDQILTAASKLFLEKGFQAVTMDQMAVSVPVSKPTLYTHFADKRVLFQAVVEKRCENVLYLLKEEMEKNRSLEEGLQFFGHQFLDMLLSKESLRFYRIMVAESLNFPEMAQKFYETGPQKMHKLLIDFLTKAEKPKNIIIKDPVFAADAFLSMLKGRVHLRYLLGLETSPQNKNIQGKQINTIVHFFLNAYRS